MTDTFQSFKINNDSDNTIREYRRKAINGFIKKTTPNVGQLKKNENGIDSRDLRLKEAATDFEKIFVKYMVKDMWKVIPIDENSKVPGENLYLEMIQSALANELVKGKGLGIADMLYKQIKNMEKQKG